MLKGRQPYHQKSNFNFSSNLAGKIYNNHRFLSSCSYLDAEIKLSTAGSDQDQNKIKTRKRFSVGQIQGSEMNRENRGKEVRSAASNYDNRYSSKNIPTSLKRAPTSTDRRPSTSVKIMLQPDKKQNEQQTKRNSLLQSALSYATQFLNSKKATRKRSLKRKLAFNPHVDTFFSPYVYIRIIEKISDIKEVDAKSIKVNFEKIYKKLIKTQLMGEFTANFMETVERYLREIVEAHEMYINPFDIQLEPQFKSISRKEEFLQRVVELWGEGQTLKIHELVKYYCIPSETTSAQILKELINDLVIEIYEKKCCNRDIEYILLNDNGQEITHISQIYFSTLELLITPKQTTQKNYFHYRRLFEQHDKSKKMTMRQSIKHNFVQKITKDKIDDNKINYQVDPNGFKECRKQAIKHANKLIESKSNLRLQSKKQKLQSQLNLSKFLEHPPSRNDNLFTHYVLRKRKERREYKVILQKLSKILDPEHVYSIKSKLHDKTEEQFRKLRLFNDKYDITYNYNRDNSGKMFLINMIENCSIFNRRTTEQLQKLLNMIEVIYGEGMDNINEIFYWQFQQIYETAHGVANQDVIMKFVLNYLNFDEFGEMKKDDFFQLMDICLSQSGRPQRIIKYILWNYLQKLQLIQNNAIRKKNLEIWYQPVKVVYMLLLSIIFGGQYETVEEMVGDLLMEEYQ